MLRDRTIVITGLTGQVGKPVAEALAADNEVIGLARFSNPSLKDELEAARVNCVVADLGGGEFADVPHDPDYVLHFAVAKTTSFEADLRDNAEGTGLLMEHCRQAKAFLHCSSTAVYQPNGHHEFHESDPLGDSHRVPVMEAFMPTYSICKIASESTARLMARTLNLPTVIARLNVPYGHSGGWPLMHLEMMLADGPVHVHSNSPSIYNPIHDDDILRQIPALLDVASVPAVTLNWAGKDAVSIEEWCGYMGELIGKEARFEHIPDVLESVTTNNELMHSLIGETEIHWKDGMRRMVEQYHPELLS